MTGDEFPTWAAIVNGLRRNAAVEVTRPTRDLPMKSNMAARAVAFYLAELEKASGVPIAQGPGAYATLLNFVHGSLAWRFKGDEWIGGGEIHFPAIGAVLSPCAATPGWHVLDDHPNAGDGVMAVLRPEGGQWSIGLYDNGEIAPMDIDFATYMRTAIELRGWFSWQRLFCRESLRGDLAQFRRKSLAAMFEHLPTIAPEVDLSPYAARFEERGGGKVAVTPPRAAKKPGEALNKASAAKKPAVTAKKAPVAKKRMPVSKR